MAKQTKLFLPTGYRASGQTFVNADGTTAKTLFTPGADDSDLKIISLTTDDTSTVNMQLFYFSGATTYLIGTIRAVTLSGFDGAANAIDMLNSTACPSLPVDDAGKRYIPVKAGDLIKIAPLANVTSTKTAYIMAIGQDY